MTCQECKAYTTVLLSIFSLFHWTVCALLSKILVGFCAFFTKARNFVMGIYRLTSGLKP